MMDPTIVLRDGKNAAFVQVYHLSELIRARHVELTRVNSTCAVSRSRGTLCKSD